MTLPGLPANTPSASSPFSTNAHTQKGSLFDRALNTGRLQTLSSRLVYRLAVILKGAVSDAEGSFERG